MWDQEVKKKKKFSFWLQPDKCFHGDSKSYPADKINHCENNKRTSWVGVTMKWELLSSVVRVINIYLC